MNTLKTINLRKEFKLSQKQKRAMKTDKNVIVACDDISLDIKEGEIYGLLGPNGAGKTTTLRMLATLIKPLKGQILYNDKDIYDDIVSYRRKIGFLTSELKLDDFFTPDYTFTYMGRLYGMSDELIKERKEELFNKFGVTPFKDTKISSLSTGMKQKTSLAISLCHDPDIIIFDEPTNGLDIIASREVENYLLNLKEKKKTIIISTHIFSLIEKLADRVGIILNGKLLVEDSLKNITKDTTLEDAFFKIYEESEK